MAGGMMGWWVVTNLGTVKVYANSVDQAKNRAKWKAAHARFVFRNKAEELTAVRECEVMSVTRAER